MAIISIYAFIEQMALLPSTNNPLHLWDGLGPGRLGPSEDSFHTWAHSLNIRVLKNIRCRHWYPVWFGHAVVFARAMHRSNPCTSIQVSTKMRMLMWVRAFLSRPRQDCSCPQDRGEMAWELRQNMCEAILMIVMAAKAMFMTWLLCK